MLHHNRHYQINYICGWQYIFSPKFRSQIHQKWGGNAWLRVFCVIGGIGGMVITSAIFVLMVAASRELIQHL